MVACFWRRNFRCAVWCYTDEDNASSRGTSSAPSFIDQAWFIACTPERCLVVVTAAADTEPVSGSANRVSCGETNRRRLEGAEVGSFSLT